MKILILQHIECETPGYIKDLMIADGFDLTTIELDVGEKIPGNLIQFDGMFCMGGPMDTWMTKEYPWLIEEKNKIKEFVIDLKKPFLGFCLGCQLLGEVVGGKVVKSSPPEIGILDINIEDEKICVLHFDSCTYKQWETKFDLLKDTTEEKMKKIPFPFYKNSIRKLKKCGGEKKKTKSW